MADKQLWNHIEGKAVRYTIRDFEAQFPDDSTCLEWLRQFWYPNGVHCDKCKRVTKHHRVASRPSYSCDQCGHHVHPTAGTIFHKSTTPLRLWFYAIYLMSSSRCGISAKHLERELGVTYKTAWRMFKQIRTMLNDETPFDGDRPVDTHTNSVEGLWSLVKNNIRGAHHAVSAK
jgi:transposase